jgi:hypothetical protein
VPPECVLARDGDERADDVADRVGGGPYSVDAFTAQVRAGRLWTFVARA